MGKREYSSNSLITYSLGVTSVVRQIEIYFYDRLLGCVCNVDYYRHGYRSICVCVCVCVCVRRREIRNKKRVPDKQTDKKDKKMIHQERKEENK